MDLTGRLFPPPKTDSIPKQSQWLSGEGGGAWFFIQKESENYRIKRFTPEGIQDCDRIFTLINKEEFEDNSVFEVIHISHCARVKVMQNGVLFVFKFVE